MGQGEMLFTQSIAYEIILRLSIVFGQGDQFVNRFYNMLRFSLFLPVFGGGENKMQPLYVHDLIRCVAVVVSEKKWQGKTIELGGQGVHSLKDIMKKIIQWYGKKRWIISLPYFLGSMVGKISEWIMPSLLTYDQVQLLQKDNIVQIGAIPVKDLKIEVVDFMHLDFDQVIGV